MSKVIAVLYNDKEQLDNFVNSYLETFGLEGWTYSEKTGIAEMEDGDTWIICKGDSKSIRDRFCATTISHFIVVDDTMYSGEGLRYLTSRMRL